MTMKRLVIILFLTAVSFINNGVNAEGAVTTTVDSNDVGNHNSIAIDSLNHVHISYAAGGGFHFNSTDAQKYATNASGQWVITTVDSAGNVGGYSSIAVDPSNNLHISYKDYTNGDLKYATNASGQWVITTVASTGDVGDFSSIALDSADKIHISYVDQKNLKYTTNASGNWVTTTVTSIPSYGFPHPSMALDSKDSAHISYLSGGDLKYATNVTGNWVITTVESDVDGGGNPARYTSIAIDSGDKVHISYLDDSWDDHLYHLKYATNASGNWITTVVESGSGMTGEYSSIAVDSAGNAHISYFDYANEFTKYASNATGDWVIAVIDYHGYLIASIDGYTAITTDSENNVHVSYHHVRDDSLKYAYYKLPSYYADGIWNYTESNSWASAGCAAEAEESGTATVIQKGNSATLVSDGIIFYGSVSGEDYSFMGFLPESGGITEITFDLKLSSHTLGSGKVAWKWEDNFPYTHTCYGGHDITISRQGPTPVLADFKAIPTSGVMPLSVNFTDQSLGEITSWSWAFGDSSTSTEHHPMHIYDKPGVYTVSLTINGPGGSDTETKSDYIEVKAKAMPWVPLLLDD
jgi:hypothetical protein